MQTPRNAADEQSTRRGPAGGSWRFDVDAARAALAGPAWTSLEELGVVAASGADAVAFLQGQLTNDVRTLGPDRLVLNGYCTAKGRLLATFRVWRDDQAVYLLLPREVLPGVLKRLAMFVLRAKARLADESASWAVFALLGDGAQAQVEEKFGAVPHAPGECVMAGDVRVARLAPGAEVADRFLLIAPAAQAEAVRGRLSALREAEAGLFWWSEIQAGTPTVFSATQENFVPQMINFEVIGGVSFSKGCYPGQEVVARSQYRGKLKRRMALAHSLGSAAAGGDVYAAGEAEPVGSVVMAAASPNGGFDLLVECPLEKFDLPLRLSANDGPALELRDLPYALVDVTA